MNNFFIWLTFIIVALVVELGTPGLFYFLSFAIGAAAAAGADFLGYVLLTQCCVCLGVTLAAGFLLYSVVRKSLAIKTTPTNNDALIGQKALVLETITPERAGTAKIYGEIWLARTQNTNAISPGEMATIVGIEGCHLIVQ